LEQIGTASKQWPKRDLMLAMPNLLDIRLITPMNPIKENFR
jgi:hypothetical protein